jgi:hypothetical protein
MDEKPEEFLETGKIVIRVGIDADGQRKRAFGIDGMDPAEAIGHLTTMIDIVRENQKRSWFSQHPEG